MALIPEKVHEVMTESIKAMVKATLFGSQVTTNKDQAAGLTLAERDELAAKKDDCLSKNGLG